MDLCVVGKRWDPNREKVELRDQCFSARHVKHLGQNNYTLDDFRLDFGPHLQPPNPPTARVWPSPQRVTNSPQVSAVNRIILLLISNKMFDIYNFRSRHPTWRTNQSKSNRPGRITSRILLTFTVTNVAAFVKI